MGSVFCSWVSLNTSDCRGYSFIGGKLGCGNDDILAGDSKELPRNFSIYNLYITSADRKKKMQIDFIHFILYFKQFYSLNIPFCVAVCIESNFVFLLFVFIGM